MKAFGHAHGATVNDVIVTAVAGALRRYLRARESLVDELTAIVPFNLRPLDKPLPADLGNRFGLVSLRLPVGMGDRRARLREVHERMEEIKHSPEGAISYGVLEAIGTHAGARSRSASSTSSRRGERRSSPTSPARASRLPGRDADERRARLGAVLGQRRR